ncbi:uncharacterized protein ACNS7B_006259 [Menidia menidia]
MLAEITCRRIFQQKEEKKAQQQQQRARACTRTRGWAKSCCARPRCARPSGGGGRGGGGGRPPPLHRPRTRPLRPVYVKGTRARGMRAPENTNQFLMHEQYQLLRMRSDSAGSEPELSDMDSYLGVLENARGALLDTPEPPGAPGASGTRTGTRTDPEGAPPQEDSLQYFPSEDDLQQSSRFMQRDFVEFCGFLGP